MVERIETKLTCGREDCGRPLILKDKSDCFATCEGGDTEEEKHPSYAVSTKFLENDILEPSPIPVYITPASVLGK